MAVRLEGIHFLVTYRCTYACDHCFVWGSPDADGTMTLAQLTSVIDQGAAAGAHRRVLRGRRAHPGLPGRARGGAACPRARPGRRHRQQLLLGDVDRRREGVAGAVRRARPGRPLPLVLRLLRRGRERGAAAQRRAGGAGARHPRERARGGGAGGHRRARRLLRRRRRGHVQGAGRRRARARQGLAAARDARHLPLRGLHRSGPRSRRPGRRAAGVPGRQRRQRLRRRRRTAGARGPGRAAARRPARPRSTPTTRSPARSSARSSPAVPGPSPRPSATRRSARCTPTNATCATKSAPHCAAQAASPKWSRPGQCYAENEPEEGEDHAV